ncbi:MAG: YaaR family protein [Selenomonadaceae bacterium]|nr:YaaR family protein [Selenomonadaceae bacterium]MBP3723479.1 YaaR family protein [Selenomonadaceae bacterium]
MAMKVGSFSNQTSSVMRMPEHNTAVKGAESEFSMELYDEQKSSSIEDLEKLMKKIDEQGERLSQTPTYDELKEYRTLIKNFVGEAVSRMYDMNTEAGWDRMGRQKVYTTVRKIDRKLEDMAEQIRLGQADKLDILASHDAIRGMLLDLYL